jgi:hypothetical protein
MEEADHGAKAASGPQNSNATIWQLRRILISACVAS